MQTFYGVLEVSEKATSSQIKAAYLRLVRKHHPDTSGNSSTKMFISVQQAYKTLGSDTNRSEYDKWLRGVRGESEPVATAPLRSEPATPATPKEGPSMKAPTAPKSEPKSHSASVNNVVMFRPTLRGMNLRDWFGMVSEPEPTLVAVA